MQSILHGYPHENVVAHSCLTFAHSKKDWINAVVEAHVRTLPTHKKLKKTVWRKFWMMLMLKNGYGPRLKLLKMAI